MWLGNSSECEKLPYVPLHRAQYNQNWISSEACENRKGSDSDQRGRYKHIAEEFWNPIHATMCYVHYIL